MFIKDNIVILSSVIVVTFVNLIENLVHYNIGRNHNVYSNIHLHFPNMTEMKKIILVMTMFAVVQYFGTLLVYRIITFMMY